MTDSTDAPAAVADGVPNGTFDLFSSTTMDLPVELTTEERADRGQELAKLGQLIEEREDNRRAVMSELKGEIDGLKVEAAKLRTSVASGEEERPVKVEKWGNHDANLVRFVRTDTDEVFEERAMEADERQGSLFAGDDDGENTADGPGDDDHDHALEEGDDDPVLPPEPGDDAAE